MATKCSQLINRLKSNDFSNDCEVKQCDQNIMTEHKKNAELLHGTGITVRRNTDTDKETIYFGIMLTIVL